MRRGLLRTVALLGVAAVASGGQARPAVAGHLANDAFAVSWTATDITARRTGQARTSFSFRAFARAGLAAVAHDGSTLTRHHRVAVVSLAGPLLALRDDITDDVRPAAHPSGVVRFWTIDLSRAAPPRFDASGYAAADPAGDDGRIVVLSELVSAPAIARALGRDPVVRRAVGEPPADLDDLLSAWRDAAGNLDPTASRACYAVDPDVLSSFAIIGATATTISVRLGLGGQGACRADFTQLGLTLPQPARAVTSVLRAPAGTPPLDFADRQ